jgi:predicted ATPase
MISSLSLVNFKCFKSLSLDLGMINVLAGMNGAGKSTVIQSLLAVRQSWESGSIARRRIQLNGLLTDLGTSGEVYCADPTNESVELTMRSATAAELRFTCPQDKELSRDYFLRFQEEIPPEDAAATFNLLSEPFNYLHAERVGPRKVFEIAPDEAHPLRVGKFGENAPYMIGSDYRETRIENSAVVLESSDGKEYPTIQYQWVLWMARLFPGFDGESEIYARADQIRLGLALQRQQTGQSLFVRPTNTGFGLSFVLGIIVAGLVAKPGTMLIVENPEAHLHPRAQSILGEFLGRVSAGNTQVIVETHSEHVVNGIRRMIKQNIVAADNVRLYFFGKEAYVLEPTVTGIRLSDTAELSAWPDGFFDQLDKDLNLILS